MDIQSDSHENICYNIKRMVRSNEQVNRTYKFHIPQIWLANRPDRQSTAYSCESNILCSSIEYALEMQFKFLISPHRLSGSSCGCILHLNYSVFLRSVWLKPHVQMLIWENPKKTQSLSQWWMHIELINSCSLWHSINLNNSSKSSFINICLPTSKKMVR